MHLGQDDFDEGFQYEPDPGDREQSAWSVAINGCQDRSSLARVTSVGRCHQLFATIEFPVSQEGSCF